MISASKAIGDRTDTVAYWQAAGGSISVATSREGRQSEAVAGWVAVVVVGAGARALEHVCRRVALPPGGCLCGNVIDRQPTPIAAGVRRVQARLVVSVLAALPVQIGEAFVHVKKHARRLLAEKATLQRVAVRAHGAHRACAGSSTLDVGSSGNSGERAGAAPATLAVSKTMLYNEWNGWPSMLRGNVYASLCGIPASTPIMCFHVHEGRQAGATASSLLR